MAAELELPESAGYDVLAVMYGQAGLGERDAFQDETSLLSAKIASSSPLSSGDEEMENVMSVSQLHENTTITEAEMVTRASQGDKDALIALYENHVDRIYRYVHSKVSSVAEAEELISETFTRAFEAIRHDRYRWQSKLFGDWLLAIAHNVLRKRKLSNWQPIENQDSLQELSETLVGEDSGRFKQETQQGRALIHFPSEDFHRRQILALTEPASKVPALAKPSFSMFVSYASEDQALVDELRAHLSLLQHQNIIRDWHEHRINAGAELKDEIIQHLNTAQVILLLVSVDFINSDYCYGVEVNRALERHGSGEAIVIPILLRPVSMAWRKHPFAKLQVLPTNAKPVVTWRNREEAFVNVANGIRDVINNQSFSPNERGSL